MMKVASCEAGRLDKALLCMTSIQEAKLLLKLLASWPESM